jgi:hypothetical protein
VPIEKFLRQPVPPCRILRKVKLLPPPPLEHRQLSPWEGIHYLEIFPENLEEVEQFLGLRPRPPVQLPHIAGPAAGGVAVAGPPGVVAPGVLPAGTPKLAKPNSPDALEWVGRALEPKELGRAPARLGVQVTSGRNAASAPLAKVVLEAHALGYLKR